MTNPISVSMNASKAAAQWHDRAERQSNRGNDARACQLDFMARIYWNLAADAEAETRQR